MANVLKQFATDWLWHRSMARTHSRWEWRTAARYTDYRDRARRSARKSARQAADRFGAQAAEYAAKDFTSLRTETTAATLTRLADRVLAAEQAGENVLKPDAAPLLGAGWKRFPEVEELLRGDLGDAFRAVFGTEFKISHGFFHRKKGGVATTKLWHSDSGPATCLNVFCYLADGMPENGPTLLLPWQESCEIFMQERKFLRRMAGQLPAITKDKAARRDCLAEFYESRINASYRDKVEMPGGPAGAIVIFNNNILHAAQPPAPGHERLTLHMRVYPSDAPPDFARYAEHGLPRKRPYPEPDAAF